MRKESLENNICEHRHRHRRPRTTQTNSRRKDSTAPPTPPPSILYATVTIPPHNPPPNRPSAARHRPQLIIKLDLEAFDLRVSDPKRARGARTTGPFVHGKLVNGTYGFSTAVCAAAAHTHVMTRGDDESPREG